MDVRNTASQGGALHITRPAYLDSKTEYKIPNAGRK